MSETTHKTVFSNREKLEVQGQEYQINYRVKYNIPDDTYECAAHLLRVTETDMGTYDATNKAEVHTYEQITNDRELIEPHLRDGIKRCKDQAVHIELRLDVDVDVDIDVDVHPELVE
jgi:hypothetical protein